MKWVLRLGGALILIAALGVGALFYYLDSVVEAAIERGASYALGVETRVGSVSLGLVSGTFRMRGFKVANAPGFESDHFLSLDDARFAVTLESLRQDTIEAPLLSLDGLEVALEKRDGKNNYDLILANLRRFESGDPQPPDEPEGAGTSFIVGELAITNVVARVDLIEQLREDDTVVEIPEIRLRNIGTGNAGGVAMAELTNIVTKAVLTAVATQKGGQLPLAVAKELGRGLGGLGKVSFESTDAVGLARKAAAGALRGKDVGGVAAEALGGLLRGKKKD